MRLEADPPVVARVGVDGRGRASPAGRAGERRGGPRQLAEQVERELEAPGRAAVLVLVPVAVRVDDAVGVERPLEGRGRVERAAQPDLGAPVRGAARQRERRELDGEGGTERAGRPAPWDRGPVARADREHEVERGLEPLGPERSESGGERLAEQPDVRGVDVVPADPVVGVVQVVPRVLAEHRRDASHQPVEHRRVGQEAEALATQLAARQDGGVVAGEQVGVQELDPVRAVGRARDLVERGRVEPLEQRVAGEGSALRQRLGDAVGEEGMGRAPVHVAQEEARHRVDRGSGNALDARIGEVTEREAEVGPHVRGDGMAREHAGDPPTREVVLLQRLDGRDREAAEPRAEVGRGHGA